MNAHDICIGTVKDRGAFYTPDEMATKIAEWIVRSGTERILEPSAGSGALARAIDLQASELTGDPSQVSMLCCDIDPVAISLLSKDLPACNSIETDFMHLSPDDLGLFDAVAMNPPFTRNHALPAEVRKELRSRFEVYGAAGLWVYFLLHACSFINVGGRIACVLPASSTFTDYGRSALAQVASNFAKVEIRRIVDRPQWVNGADERGAILFAEGYKLGKSEVPGLTSWTSSGERRADFFSGNPSFYRSALANSVAFKDIAKVSIGCVTGFNEAFLLSEVERKIAEIELADVVPIVSRAKHAKGILVSPEDLRSLGSEGEKTWLLRPRDLGPRASAVRRWLARISPAKRRSTLWLNKRTPWWLVDLGGHCDAVFTYMNHGGPRVVLASGEIACTNTLHRITFSPNATLRQRNSMCLSFLSTFGQLASELGGRSYGGGILKFELKEVRELPVLKANSRCRSENLRKAHAFCISGDDESARRLADEILMPDLFGQSWRVAVKEMEKELKARRSDRMGRI